MVKNLKDNKSNKIINQIKISNTANHDWSEFLIGLDPAKVLCVTRTLVIQILIFISVIVS